MTFKMKFPMRQDILPKGTKRYSGTKMSGVKFVVLHDTGNPNSTAQGNVTYYKNSANTMSASAHVFIDDKEIIICIPLNNKAWHVLYNVTTDNKIYGDDANDIAVGVELCYFPNDKNRTLEAYKKYVWFNAWLAYEYKMNPHTSFIGHHKLDPGRKVDPVSALKVIGKTYENLLQDIVNEYMECITENKNVSTPIPTKKETTKMYKPSADAMLQDTIKILKQMETAKNGISEKWRLKLMNGELTESDVVGLIFVALSRGLFK
ncbi:peptidoglycan recognition family protein [Solibacillus sp. FSL H8-0523]|uniref:peptidoglycan recognition protein family protein n=1 Tax=Solibacillus sp. FSL H8-0523 TaxID=2954511 RepID=UPI0031010DD1